MIEKIVLNHLKAELAPAKVSLEVPEGPPAEYVVLEKTGSRRQNHIDMATFAVQSCSTTLEKAAILNEKAKAAMDSLVQQPEVSASKLNSDYNFTDTRTKKYRYQAVYNIYY